MEIKEESRKIQFTGKSSYIISLPKQWITELGLKQGDTVRIARQGASTLQIYPPKFQPKTSQKEEATIEIGTEEDTSTIIRKLISLYFLGFKTITVKPKTGRLKPNQRVAVKEAVKRMLMGSEIIADSTNEITIQVLVNLFELSVDGAFKRMIHLAKSMLNDAILAVREKNFELAKEVVIADDEVDRFGFYIVRQLKIAIQNEYMQKEMGFRSARDCLGYRLVVKNIERTGDHAVFIAKDLLEFKKEIKEEIIKKIEEMKEFALGLLDEACLALFKEDYTLAEKTILRESEISKFEKKIRDETKNLSDDEDKYRVRRIIENIRRIAEYSSDVAEIALNMNIEKALKKKN